MWSDPIWEPDTTPYLDRRRQALERNVQRAAVQPALNAASTLRDGRQSREPHLGVWLGAPAAAHQQRAAHHAHLVVLHQQHVHAAARIGKNLVSAK